MNAQKTIGTLLPIFSLRSNSTSDKHQGTIEDAYPFLNWLHDTKQKAWQMLPLHETHLIKKGKSQHAASPYKGYGIGLDPKYFRPIEKRQEKGIIDPNTHPWLPDYALFCALRDHFGTDKWTDWDQDIKNRQLESIQNWTKKLEKSVMHYKSQQLIILEEYRQMRKTAKRKNILLIGDLPFYLPLQSPLVWKYQHLFEFDSTGNMSRVSGVVNEPKATYGRQVWGHPLYKWNIAFLEKDLAELFMLRLNYLHQLFDVVRLDHAIGLFRYGSIDPTDEKNDRNEKGPGFIFLKSLVDYANQIGLKVFAEDASVELTELRQAMNKLGVPGIRILKYAYDQYMNIFEKDYAEIHSYPKNSVAYSTTHDTETLMGFIKSLTLEQKKELAKRLNIPFDKDNTSFAKIMRDSVINSPANLVLIQMQDWLLSSERINVPGTEKEENDPNWKYQLSEPVEKLPLDPLF